MLQALPPEPPGEVIVVTGKALPAPAGDAAQHVDLLDRRELRDAPSHALDAVLAQVPGLQLFRRSDSTSGHPTSQGVTLRALGGNASSRALLVLDGVPQADPFGGWVNWPAYGPAGLDEAQVIRGGGSVTHGPGALAGVIDLRSLTDEATDGALELGSRESLNGQIYTGQRLGGGLLTLFAQGRRSNGFTPVTRATRGPADRPAPYEQASLRSRWVAPLGGSVEMQLGALAFVDERERGLRFTDNRTRGADLSARFVARGRWQWSALGYAQWRNLRSSFASVTDDRSSASRVSLQDSVPSRGLGAGFEVRPPLGRVELRLGADARHVEGESRELFSFVGGEPTRRRIAGGASATFGLFSEATMRVGALTLSAGARIDRWRISDGELVERFLSSGATIRDDRFADRSGWRPTARAGAVLDLQRGFSLRAAGYIGWRMPTLNELFRPFRAGPDATAANPLLDPERLTGAEAGVGYRRGGIDVSLTAFANRLSDAIANVTLGQGPGVFPGVGFVAGAYRQRLNIDAVRVRGIEASAEARRHAWSLRLGASLTDARVRADGPAATLDGLRPAQTPSLVLTGSLSWEHDGAAASLFLRHSGRQFEDDQNERALPAATTVGAFFGWPLSDRLQLVARGENLFDERVVAGIADDGTTERATPRTLWIGIRLRPR